MEAYLIYIGKSALAVGAFYLAYLLLFQNQKHFVFNRIYLPVSFAVSFLIPLITFSTVKFVEPTSLPGIDSFAYLPETDGIIDLPRFKLEWFHYFFAIYGLGILVFLMFLITGHLKAVNIIRLSLLKNIFSVEVNITPKDVHPFSFFNKIVLSKKTLQNPNLKMIVQHEQIHVKERHTLDILFSEILFLFQWFNPFAWLIKDAIRNNLEYKTDHEITKTHNPQKYQLAMVELADKDGVAPFLTALNGSQLKNRIIMMKQKTENRYSLLKQLVVLPLLAVLVMGLSNKEVKTEIVQPEKENNVSIAPELDKTIQGNEICNIKVIVDGKEIPSTSPELKKIKLPRKSTHDLAFDVVQALNIELEKVKYSSTQERKDSATLYIRTSDYIEGTNPEFENRTSKRISLNKEDDNPKTYYAVDEEIVSKEEFEKAGKIGFARVIFLEEDIAASKYGEDYRGKIIDATSGGTNFTIQNEFVVKGKVTNENGEAIAGVAILIKGKTIGTISNIKGEYEIKLEDENSIIVFAMAGYLPREVRVSGREKIDVLLFAEKEKSTEKTDSDEIKVIAYGRQAEGSQHPANSVLIHSTGAAGNKHPLFIVDGEETDNIEAINPETIESVSVLKNESATSIYGEKAKNGAVIIALKKEGASGLEGKDGEDKVNPKVNPKKRKIMIGPGGLLKSNSPLFILDGKEVKNMDDIDPNSIKSISVLKNKAATEPYGERGKNGVVIIEVYKGDELKQRTLPVVLNGEFTKHKLFEMDRKLVDKIKSVPPKKAVRKYGEKGKNGVFEVTSRKLYTEKVEVESSEIKTEKDLRKFIAREIKFPGEARGVGFTECLVLTQIDASGNVKLVSKKPSANYVKLDEVVVVAYKADGVEDTDPKKVMKICNAECERVINLLPAISVPELLGKEVGFVIKFQVQ